MSFRRPFSRYKSSFEAGVFLKIASASSSCAKGRTSSQFITGKLTKAIITKVVTHNQSPAEVRPMPSTKKVPSGEVFPPKARVIRPDEKNNTDNKTVKIYRGFENFHLW